MTKHPAEMAGCFVMRPVHSLEGTWRRFQDISGTGSFSVSIGDDILRLLRQ